MLQKIVRSTVIDAPIERVWAVLREFNSHDQWHSAIKASRIEGDERGDQIGCVRNFTLTDGNHIREQLLSLSDVEHKATYCIVEATVPLQRYVATLTLKRISDGNRTFWHWESTFNAPAGMERQLCDMVSQGVYETGFRDLRHYLLRDADQRTQDSTAMPSALLQATRRVALYRYGDADVMQIEHSEAPAPREGEVRIRQRAIGVNYLDVYLRRGWLPGMLPVNSDVAGVPGMEAAGTVLDVGANVNGLLPGDRVAYLGTLPGAYCGIRCVPAEWVVRLPATVSEDTAAALLLKGITADLLLRDLGRVERGTRVLVHAAAGGVGLLVCAWARSLGATVLGTVSTDEKARIAREYGCEHVIVTRDYKFADAVQRACGGADVVIDGLGNAARDENIAALARRGHWISLGQATGVLAPLPPDALVAKSLSFSRPSVFDFVSTNAQLVARAQRVWAALENGDIRMPPVERYALDAAATAHARLESRATVGALILST